MSNPFMTNPLLRKFSAGDDDANGRIFSLAQDVSDREGTQMLKSDIELVKEHSHTRRVKTAQGPQRRRYYNYSPRLVAAWEVPGISENQFRALAGVVRDIKAPYAIRGIADESGRHLSPKRYPKLDGKSSARYRGYFVGRKNYDGESGLLVFRDFGDYRKAEKGVRKPNWFYGDGPHRVEIREDSDLRHLTYMEYVMRVSGILGGRQPIARDQAIYRSYRDLMGLEVRPRDISEMVGLGKVLDEMKWLLFSEAMNPVAAEYYGARSQSALLAGVPGVGKTLLAEILVGEDLNTLFIPVQANSLVDSKVDSDGKYRDGTLFGELNTLQEQAGVLACLYCDDIESAMLDPRQSMFHERYLATSSALLNRLAGMQMNPRTKLSGSTNNPEIIDSRFLEFGRIGYVLHIPLPGEQDRYGAFKVHTKGRPVESGLKFDSYVQGTDGFTYRDIAEVCNATARNAMRRAAESIAKPGEDPIQALGRLDEGVLADFPITEGDFGAALGYVGAHIRPDYNRQLDKRIGQFCEGYHGGQMGFGQHAAR